VLVEVCVVVLLLLIDVEDDVGFVEVASVVGVVEVLVLVDVASVVGAVEILVLLDEVLLAAEVLDEPVAEDTSRAP